ncbi:MAG: BatA and WFA domain-containing protein [Verrucomicrobiota bacterium]
MTFLAPLFFWSFLSFLPLVAVYFLKVRPQKRETTAYFLWQKVFTEKKTASLFQRLRDLWSLALMALVFGAVCLALTKPELATSERRDLLILLDNSTSMAAGEGGNQRLALAREAAGELIRGMDGTQRAAVAAVAQEVTFLSHQTDNPRQLLDAVAGVAPTSLALRPGALAGLRSGDSAEWMKNHRVILITDGCFTDSAPPPEGVEILKVGAPLENVGMVTADAQFLPGPGNRLDIYLRAASSFKQPVRTDLVLKPEGSAAIGKLVSLTLQPGLNPGETFTIEDAAPGKWTATLELKDAFPGDNTAWLAALRPPPLRVRVEATDKFFLENSVQAFSGDSGFLTLVQDSPQLVLSKSLTPDAPLAVIFQPEGDSPWWSQPGAELENVVPRVKIPDHPVLRHVDAAGLSFAGARQLKAPEGSLVLVDTEEGVPLLYIVRRGDRAAAVVNMDPLAAEFYYSAWFPVLVYTTATSLAAREEPLAAAYAPGSTIPVPGGGDGKTTQITTPDGATGPVSGATWGPLPSPGFYSMTNASGSWLTAASLMTPGESLLDNSATATTLQPIARGWPPYLLLTLAGIVVLIVESLLYHRRKVG